MYRTTPVRDTGTAEVRGHLLCLAGEFDGANLDLVRGALLDVAKNGARFTVDLTGVTSMNGPALNAVWTSATSKSTVLLTAGSPLEDACRVAGLHHVTQVHSLG